MSTQPSSNFGGKPAKRPANIFTVMLLLAMLFMIIAVVAMYIELNRWAPDYYKTNTARPATSMVAPANDFYLA
ncbi:hypothetical protein [Aporhodopirellula aestuarii]|uniref:Uncharacterized protein n=1 Tax=Aporhodopirellula aestuarii TaxID=2950107 RepID=A0ABT0TX88_9BACT|nr:hypothetical protein [Aporhodopirellula aestuarii]MCM2369228.1 hypothetical protein [Aporhodopirellula aestuarii]